MCFKALFCIKFVSTNDVFYVTRFEIFLRAAWRFVILIKKKAVRMESSMFNTP